MTPSDPRREPDLETAGDPQTAGRVADPWGVKRAENLLTSLQGVLSARVEVSPIGEVTAVHVLTGGGGSPKQTVRNVESALLAHLGLKVDHRKISVAQTAEVQPIEALEQSAVQQEALRRQVTFRAVDVRAGGGQRVSVAVTLLVRGDEVTGESEVADTPTARVQGAARAALRALDRVVERGTLELEGARRFEEFDADVVMVGVQTVEDRGTQLMVGTARVQGSVERAAVLAVLDATNRWLQARA